MLDSYRNRMAAIGGYEGEFRRQNAQKIMDASWMRDPATKPVYVKWVDSGLPIVDDFDEQLYAKYNVKSYHNITGDSVAYLLQFRLDDIKSNSNIRVGSYVQIPNETNQMEWWLIVHEDDRTQFHQFSILKCTWTYKWVSRIDGKRVVYECLGAPRKQNSYNSGVWLDYTTQTVENQEVMWLPTNEDTKTIQYDTKFLKSSPGRYPALKWSVTKIEDTATDGISKFTVAQTQFDPARDNVELGIADYWESAVEPVISNMEDVASISELEITHAGTPSIKAGGGYKKFTLKQYVGENLMPVSTHINWSINGEIVNTNSDGAYRIVFGESNGVLSGTIQNNELKVKCANEYALIGQKFTLTATTEYGSKSLIVEVTSL